VPFNTSPFSFEDVRTALDAALRAKVGVKIEMDSHGAAVLFQGRANYFRRQDRKENLKTFPEGHELHSQSIYDKLKISVENSTVKIVQYSAVMLKMEELE